jgi:WD40 repeat protein
MLSKLISSILISCSLDCTIKLWSVRRGNLLFQINAPSPVTSLYIDSSDKVYAACQNRLLVFGIVAHSKEAELPPIWKVKTPTAAEHEEDMTNKRRSLGSAAHTTRVSTADYTNNDFLHSMQRHDQENGSRAGNDPDERIARDSVNQTTRKSVNQASRDQATRASEYQSTNQRASVNDPAHRTSVAVISQSPAPRTPANPDRFVSTISRPDSRSNVSSADEKAAVYARQRQKSAEIRRMISASSGTDQNLFLETLMGQEAFEGVDKRMLAMNLAEYGIDDKMVLELISSSDYMMIGVCSSNI